jgi:hypothetical protein
VVFVLQVNGELSNQEQDSGSAPFHEEGSAIIFDKPKNEEEITRQRREDEQHEFARAQVKTNRRLAWFTGLLVLGTFCGIGIGIWQATISQTAVNVASRTLDETVRSNKAQDLASATSLQATVDSFQLDQRAWVGAIGISPVQQQTPDKPLAFNVIFRNTGKTPALHVRVKGGVVRDLATILHNPDSLPMIPIPVSAVIMPNGSSILPLKSNRIPDEMLKGLNDGTLRITGYAVVTYEDVFHRMHLTKTCIYLEPDLKESEECEKYNEAN